MSYHSYVLELDIIPRHWNGIDSLKKLSKIMHEKKQQLAAIFDIFLVLYTSCHPTSVVAAC